MTYAPFARIVHRPPRFLVAPQRLSTRRLPGRPLPGQPSRHDRHERAQCGPQRPEQQIQRRPDHVAHPRRLACA